MQQASGRARPFAVVLLSLLFAACHRKTDGPVGAHRVEQPGASVTVGPQAPGLPDVAKHVALHEYRDGELFRVVSLGMVKFGLPDVAVNHVAAGDASPMGTLVNPALQRLVERGKLDGPGSLRVSLDDVRQPDAKKSLKARVFL